MPRFSDLAKLEDGTKFPKLLKVPMFRVGDYGEKGRYAEADLDAMAASYDPDYLEGPVTRDHIDYGPADGWIDRVYREGDTLFGDWTVHPETLKLLQEGRYKRRSIEFYRKHTMPDGSVVPYVKACSILGAATPHCKGMPNISFSDSAEESVSLSFEAEPETENHKFIQEKKTMPKFTLPAQYARFASRFTDTMSDEETHKTFSEILAEIATEQENNASDLIVAQTALAERDSEVSTLSAQVAAQGKTVAEILADNRRTKAEVKFAAVIAENRQKVSPVMEHYLKTLFGLFSELPVNETLEFAENDSAEVASIHPSEVLLGFIKNLPDVVELGGAPRIHNLHAHNKPPKGSGMPDRSDAKAMEEFNNRILKLTDEIVRDEKLEYSDAMIEAERRLA